MSESLLAERAAKSKDFETLRRVLRNLVEELRIILNEYKAKEALENPGKVNTSENILKNAEKCNTSEEQGFDFYDPKIIKFISDTIYKWHVEVKDGQLWQDERKIKYVMQAALSHASKARVPKRNPYEIAPGDVDGDFQEAYAMGYNDCIDEFLRLNPELEKK